MKRNHYIGVVIALLIVGGASFYAGTSYAKSSSSAPILRQGFAGQAAGFAGRGAGGARGSGGFTAGTIVSSSNGSISIQQQNGSSSEIVLVSPSTQVLKTVAGSASDLTVGTMVTVTGTSNSDGSLTASAIEVRPAGMGLGGGRAGATTQTQ